jgi:uncharacterized repeat protein (TIGR03803 family)
MRINLTRILPLALAAINIVTTATRLTATETVLRAFTGADGSHPASLVSDSAGNLYGVTSIGGANNTNADCLHSLPNGCGTVFELSPTSGGWQEKVLHSFNGTDGSNPIDLVIDVAGNLYGVAQRGGSGNVPCIGGQGCGTVFELTPSSSGWRFKLLHVFTGQAEGAAPNGVAIDPAGNLYITAQSGGNTTGLCGNGCGTIFQMLHTASGWRGRTLRLFDWSFTNQGATNPTGRIIFDSVGNLYGTAGGGVYNNVRGTNFGVVYELTPTAAGQWNETVLHSFCPGKICSDGSYPEAALTSDPAGDLYGTTASGGAYDSGAVFQLTPSSGVWSENILYSFTGAADGATPVASLVLDSSGNVFGTTAGGGDANCLAAGPCGVVFKLTPVVNGWGESVLHRFGGGYDGANPAGILLDAAGHLFGTTAYGGANTTACPQLCGVVYQMSVQ